MTTSPARPMLAWGLVRHARSATREHAFAYRTPFLLLPMRALAAQECAPLARNRRAAFSFHDADHGLGGPDALAWLDALLAEAGIDDADGEVWLQTLPRLLGHALKPVSFWFAHRRDGSLRAIVAEVHNTFGERHAYLLEGPGLGWGRTLAAPKRFHVSPFFEVQGEYRFRFMRQEVHGHDGDAVRLVSRVELVAPDGSPRIVTSLSGTATPLTAAAVRGLLWRAPAAAWAVTARIHTQALRLWAKRVPWHSHPGPTAPALTRGGALPARTELPAAPTVALSTEP